MKLKQGKTKEQVRLRNTYHFSNMCCFHRHKEKIAIIPGDAPRKKKVVVKQLSERHECPMTRLKFFKGQMIDLSNDKEVDH